MSSTFPETIEIDLEGVEAQFERRSLSTLGDDEVPLSVVYTGHIVWGGVRSRLSIWAGLPTGPDGPLIWHPGPAFDGAEFSDHAKALSWAPRFAQLRDAILLQLMRGRVQ